MVVVVVATTVAAVVVVATTVAAVVVVLAVSVMVVGGAVVAAAVFPGPADPGPSVLWRDPRAGGRLLLQIGSWEPAEHSIGDRLAASFSCSFCPTAGCGALQNGLAGCESQKRW